MKTSPGRKERRNLMFKHKRAAGKKRAAFNEFAMKYTAKRAAKGKEV